MDDFRDDGTRICPVHGLRFDPQLSAGCIRCAPAPSQRPKRKSTVPPKPAPVSLPPEPLPPPRPAPSYGPPARPSAAPPVPFEPFVPNPAFGASQFGEADQGQLGAKVTLIATPPRPQSRRGLVQGIGLLALAGVGATAWFLRPEAPTDWSKKITRFRYGPSGSRGGAMFVPSDAGDEPRPLLVLIDPTRHPANVCLRFARQCEHHGWIAVSSDALGGAVAATDGAEATMLLDEARSKAKIDAARPILAGFDKAADVACRLALVQPDVFGGAILECVGIGPWRDVGALAQNDVSFFFAARSKDASRDGMVIMKDEMDRRGIRVTWDELPGGNEPRERDELDTAFAWLEQMRG
jgi:hypothetical protein